jgi:hypothetical protein
MHTVSKFILPASFAATFYGNAIDNVNSQPSVGGKVKTLVNATTGKVLGLNLFQDAPQFSVNIGLSNIGNPVTLGGATLFGVGLIGEAVGLPRSRTLKSVGGKIAVGSLIGSLFLGDAPSGTTPAPTATTTLSTGQTVSI